MKKKYHTNEKENPKTWMLFDGRYRTDEDSAVCYESCDTLSEALDNVDDYGGDTVIVEFEVDGNTTVCGFVSVCPLHKTAVRRSTGLITKIKNYDTRISKTMGGKQAQT